MRGVELPPEVKEAPVYLFLQKKDEELDEEGKKAKRREKLLKAGWDARQTMRKEKEKLHAIRAEKEAKEEQVRLADPAAWLSEQHAHRLQLIQRYKDRIKLRAQLSDRRSAASQIRMKAIADLAADTTVTSTGKRKRKMTKREVVQEGMLVLHSTLLSVLLLCLSVCLCFQK